jgi:hypothetical protein
MDGRRRQEKEDMPFTVRTQPIISLVNISLVRALHKGGWEM